VRTFYRSSVVVFGIVAIGLGVALLVETTVAGGGVTGYLIGLLFIGLGIGRIYLQRRR
jgi:hypothetical protein